MSVLVSMFAVWPGSGWAGSGKWLTEAAAPSLLQGARPPRPGAAARARESAKHRRYPAGPDRPQLIPLAYETGGRAGAEAEAFLREVCVASGDVTRSEAIQSLRQRIAVALQRGNAGLLLAGGPPPGGWPWQRRAAPGA